MAPVFNALLGKAVAPHVVLINVIEAFVGRLSAIRCVGQDEILAEATPEASEWAAQPIILKLLVNQNSAAESMVVQQMGFKGVSSIEDSPAILIAVPRLRLIMLAIFVPLPVILASKGLVAARVCAAVRSLMSPSMLSII